MTSGILRGRNLDRALRGWFISAPWYRKSQLGRLEESGVTLMPGTRNCLQASLLIFGAWTGMRQRLNWAGTLNMAFPCSSGFSFTRSGLLRENILRASIWRGNIKKKKKKNKSKKLHCLFWPASKHTVSLPPHFTGYKWVTQANPDSRGERIRLYVLMRERQSHIAKEQVGWGMLLWLFLKNTILCRHYLVILEKSAVIVSL